MTTALHPKAFTALSIPTLLPPIAEALHPHAEWLSCILCYSETRGGLPDSNITYPSGLPLHPSGFKKKNCMSNERLLWGQEPLIFQAFSCFPKDFTLSFLLFSIILKSFNFVLNQTLFVVLVDSSLRKLDRILDWCCLCEGSSLPSALLLWKSNILTVRVVFIHHFRETLFLQNFLSRW